MAINWNGQEIPDDASPAFWGTAYNPNAALQYMPGGTAPGAGHTTVDQMIMGAGSARWIPAAKDVNSFLTGGADSYAVTLPTGQTFYGVPKTLYDQYQTQQANSLQELLGHASSPTPSTPGSTQNPAPAAPPPPVQNPVPPLGTAPQATTQPQPQPQPQQPDPTPSPIPQPGPAAQIPQATQADLSRLNILLAGVQGNPGSYASPVGYAGAGTPDTWNAYRAAAQQATANLNAIPFVLDPSRITGDQAANRSMMYTAAPKQTTNPLLNGFLGPFNPMLAG